MSAPRQTARVAVVVVNYQSYHELRGCLAAVRAAGNGNLQVVVIDHAADARQADAIAAAFPQVQVVRVPTNDGFAAGVNRGARETCAPFLLLLNPDCVLGGDAFSALVEWMEAHADVAVLGPRILDPDGSVQASARRFPDLTTAFAGRSSWLTRVLPNNTFSRRNLPWRDDRSAEPVEVDWVSGACMLVRGTAFEQVGGMDEGFFLYWEDADLCRRLRNAGWKTVYHRGAQVVHTGGCSSRHAADASLEAFHRSAFRLFWKHASGPFRLLAPLVFAGLQIRQAIVKRLVRQRNQPPQWKE